MIGRFENGPTMTTTTTTTTTEIFLQRQTSDRAFKKLRVCAFTADNNNRNYSESFDSYIGLKSSCFHRKSQRMKQ